MSRNWKGLAVLMRTPMRAAASQGKQLPSPTPFHPIPTNASSAGDREEISASRQFAVAYVKERMQASISIPTERFESLDANLEEFSKGYLSLPQEGRRDLLHELARNYDVNRMRVRQLMQQYLNLGFPSNAEDNAIDNEQSGSSLHDEALLASCYRMERNLRDVLRPMYGVLFERLNAYDGGLKILAVLRADVVSLLEKDNLPSLRALDSYLKEKLITWLSPAALQLHQITWDDPASLLEKIVTYEAVHPIRSLQDLRRRLSIGRRCFGYFHPAIPGEPLIFIEVALLKEVAKAIQDVLWDDPPIPEHEAICALFYSISSTQPGLSGVNLGKFLIKRVIELVKREKPNVMVFATLSPIPGYMQWLLSKLTSQLKFTELDTENTRNLSESDSSSTFKESIFFPEEEMLVRESGSDLTDGKSGIEILQKLLSSPNNEWIKSDCLLNALRPPLMRLCARYLLKEKKRGKALDPVANFHLQNGAIIERINWMADQSEKGLSQSAGIMVNYIYRLEKIEENAQSYFSCGQINASPNVHQLLEAKL
ncbi:malonyl-CoA decarboxylase [Apostasia shenzhenica]|uniref:Malonyl-CoA decarboxylase n=1 Tax=Apostasia shenzhenica TaxID=1088818 RepID=A0A2I0A7C7_9ASPA|nr:malonyl-CoA decarboxylase [Apostasia shenzhenica]